MRYWLKNASVAEFDKYNPITMATWKKYKVPLLCCGSESIYTNVVDEKITGAIDAKYLYVIENEDFTSFDYDDLPEAINGKKIVDKMDVGGTGSTEYYTLDDGTVLSSEFLADYCVMFKNCKYFRRITNMYDIFVTSKHYLGGGWRTPSVIFVENCQNFIVDECDNDHQYNYGERYHMEKKVKFSKNAYVFYIGNKFNLEVEYSESYLIKKQQIEIDILRNKLTDLENKVVTSHNMHPHSYIDNGGSVVTTNPMLYHCHTNCQ
jgi:hypothetical protein